MALVRIGGLMLNNLKPNPCFVVPSSVNMQLRHAKRKGYREKAKIKKKQAALEKVVTPKEFRFRNKFMSVKKTVETNEEDPPNDDIFIKDNFKHVKYSLSDTIKLHREYHHPTLFNRPGAPVQVLIELDITGKKQTQVLKPFKGVVPIPFPILNDLKKDVLVFCKPEDVDLAITSGASIAGGEEVVQKVKGGIIQPSLYEYIICHADFFPELSPIRGLLKTQLPKISNGTLTGNLKAAIHKFKYGIEFNVIKLESEHNFGIIECRIGTIDMELEQVEENFKTLLAEIMKHKPERDGDFITWIWCKSSPSTEQFAIDLTKYFGPDGEVLGVSNDNKDEIKTVKKEPKKAALAGQA